MINKEYKHSVFINEVKLSCDIHLVSSFLSYTFDDILYDEAQDIALEFYYASIRPREVEKSKLLQLTKLLSSVVDLESVSRWFNEYEDDLDGLYSGIIRRNILSDVLKIEAAVNVCKRETLTIYRKTIPVEVKEKAKKTLLGASLYKSKLKDG